jgi:nickel/cobalt exporter
VTADALPAGPAAQPVLPRLALALAAVALVGGMTALLLWLLAPAAPPPPTRAPFGMGLREGAPAPSGFGATILALQSSFYRSLQAAVTALKESGAAPWSLLGLGFAYGVFHAAGPGHGKAVIAAYVVASERALPRAFAFSLAAACLQALVAVTIVLLAALLFRATAAGMGRVTSGIELASFLAVALLGLAVTWRKAGNFLGVLALARDPSAPASGPGCDHLHLPPPDALDRLGRWRERVGVVLAAGARPCAGAIVVLVFALSQGLLPAGITAVAAMALGTALTTGAIAALAVFAKRAALSLAGGKGAAGAVAVAGIELLAAAFVLVLGASLLAGSWAGAGGS